MRSSRRPRQGEEDVGPSCTARRRAGNGQNCVGFGRQPGAGHKGALLSHCRKRDLLCRGQEDRGTHGELQKGNR